MQRGSLRRALALVRRRTHRAAPLAVALYERADCGLCAEAHRALRRIGLERPLDIARVDVDAEDALARRYALRVPVLAAGGQELDAAGLDDAAIARWLDGLPRPGAA